jgi:hypothetical protein
MLLHYLSRGTPKDHMAGHHLPEHHPQRVEVSANIHANSRELLWTGELRRPIECSGN